MDIEIRKMNEEDSKIISDAFCEQGWNKPEEQYRRYFDDQEHDKRFVLLAFTDREFAGYLTIYWQSFYPPFREKNIPEIMDLNLLKKHQRRGIASALMDEAEKLISEKADYAGIGVGLTVDYGNAQRMYVKRGYVPDGLGISRNEIFLKRGDTVMVDDDLVLCLMKKLK